MKSNSKAIKVIAILGIIFSLIVFIAGGFIEVLYGPAVVNASTGTAGRVLFALQAIALAGMLADIYLNINLFMKKSKLTTKSASTLAACLIPLMIIGTFCGTNMLGVLLGIPEVILLILTCVEIFLIRKDASSEGAQESTGTSKTKAALMPLLVSIIIVAVVVVIVLVVDVNNANSKPRKAAEYLSNFSAVTLDGDTYTSAELQGHKLVVVNVWSTTCKYCKQEMPDLEEVYQKYKDQDVVLVGICDDTVSNGNIDEEARDYAKEICDENGVTFAELVPTDDGLCKMTTMVTDVGHPVTVILDENGDVLDIVVGATDAAGWSETIESYLN